MRDLLKRIYKKLLYGYKSSSESYTRYLRAKGVTIGANTSFYEPNTNYIDTQKPWLIEIGNNVEITRGVTIISHDYAWSVIKQNTGEIIGSRGKVTIGNNVFIGMNTTILQGSKIGSNVIIGANSVVNSTIPDGMVAVGAPARVVGTVEAYTQKRRSRYINEAKELFAAYYEKCGSVPDKTIFDEFFWLFEERDPEKLPAVFREKMRLTGNFEETCKAFEESEPFYPGYGAFAAACMKEIAEKTAD